MMSQVITVSPDELERLQLAREFRSAHPFKPLDDQDIDCVSAMNVVVARSRKQEAEAQGIEWAAEDIGNSEQAAMAAMAL
jgi:hypothetical protein